MAKVGQTCAQPATAGRAVRSDVRAKTGPLRPARASEPCSGTSRGRLSRQPRAGEAKQGRPPLGTEGENMKGNDEFADRSGDLGRPHSPPMWTARSSRLRRKDKDQVTLPPSHPTPICRSPGSPGVRRGLLASCPRAGEAPAPCPMASPAATSTVGWNVSCSVADTRSWGGSVTSQRTTQVARIHPGGQPAALG